MSKLGTLQPVRTSAFFAISFSLTNNFGSNNPPSELESLSSTLFAVGFVLFAIAEIIKQSRKKRKREEGTRKKEQEHSELPHSPQEFEGPTARVITSELKTKQRKGRRAKTKRKKRGGNR